MSEREREIEIEIEIERERDRERASQRERVSARDRAKTGYQGTFQLLMEKSNILEAKNNTRSSIQNLDQASRIG